MAEGGTLFLDEIGEMPLSLQVKLLDFLQDGTFTRVGGTEKRRVMTRVITATNRNLKKMCDEGKFRKDLYYRINVVPLEIPPLRERPADIDALAKHFISKCNSKYKGEKKLDTKTGKVLHNYSWPGNVRELEHIIEHVYILSEGENITEEEMRSIIFNETDRSSSDDMIKCEGLMPLKEAKWMLEKTLVTQAYAQLGSTYKAAEALHVDQSTIVKLLKKHSE